MEAGTVVMDVVSPGLCSCSRAWALVQGEASQAVQHGGWALARGLTPLGIQPASGGHQESPIF